MESLSRFAGKLEGAVISYSIFGNLLLVFTILNNDVILRHKIGHHFNLRINCAAVTTAFVYPEFHFIPPRAISIIPRWGKNYYPPVHFDVSYF
ncbi:MAG TPA: hypothetical protein DCY97_15005 [Marinilabiliales bacterium]|nr:hypothetical protein [Marinilabiliales bacterium]